VQQFREIKNLGHVCFSFGGIGGTVDDRTRQSVARAHEREMIRHPDAVAEIEAQFGEQAYPNRILMADLPAGSEIIPNPVNRVPGFTLDKLHCLPGFPEMAWPMMEWVLDNNYAQLPKTQKVQQTLVLQDVHESDLIELLEQFQLEHKQVKLSSLPSLPNDGRFQIELGITGLKHDVETAMRMLKQTLKQSGLF
jgi:molybdopterin-biosynthesis enzyme MoeA-like protein